MKSTPGFGKKLRKITAGLLLAGLVAVSAGQTWATTAQPLVGPEAGETEIPGVTSQGQKKGSGKLTDAPFSVKIHFDKTDETLTEKDTAGWRQQGADGYVWNDDLVAAYFQTLAAKYDTEQGKVMFTNHAGKKYEFHTENCGWHMNIEQSVASLENGVDEGKDTVDPMWNSGCEYSSDNGVGQKYIEVDITEQKVFLYEYGELIFQTDCVTGQQNLSETTKGLYQVIYKASPSVLKSEDIYGNPYEQPVNYWICFNGEQGLHDATWRYEFGGDLWKSQGSHGCVNLPEEAAKRIYEEVYTYYPVVVY